MWIVETLDGSGIKRVVWVLWSGGPIGLPVNGNDPVVLGWDCERCSANPNGFGCCLGGPVNDSDPVVLGWGCERCFADSNGFGGCLGGNSNVSIVVVLRVRWLPRTMKRTAVTLSPKVGA